MGREIYDIVNDMAEVLNASQMQRLQEVLVKRLSENAASDHSQTTNVEFLDMFLTAKHLEGCSDKTIRYYRCKLLIIFVEAFPLSFHGWKKKII